MSLDYELINKYLKTIHTLENNLDGYRQLFDEDKLNEFKKTIEEFSFDLKYKGVFFALSKILVKSEYLLKTHPHVLRRFCPFR